MTCVYLLALVGLLQLISSGRTAPSESSAELEAYEQVESLLQHGVEYSSSESVRASRSHALIRKQLESILGQEILKPETSKSAEIRGELKSLLGKFIQLFDLKEEASSRLTFRQLSQEIGERLVEMEKSKGGRFDKTNHYLAFIVAASEEVKSKQAGELTGQNESVNNGGGGGKVDEKNAKPRETKKALSLFEKFWRRVFD